MPRPRRFGPEDCEDKRLCSVRPLARWLLLGLRTISDDQGVFRWDLGIIREWCLPNDLVDLNPLLHELEVVDLIRPFQFEGQEYGVIRDFFENQRPKKRQSWYPMPVELRRFAGHPAIRAGKGGISFNAGKDPFKSPMSRKKRIKALRPRQPRVRPEADAGLAEPSQDERRGEGVLGDGLNGANALLGPPKRGPGRPRRIHPSADETIAPQINAQDNALNGQENGLAGMAISTAAEQPELGPELAAPPKEYAFEGEALRLNRHDYDRWRMDCLALPDFDAALRACDAWLALERQARGATFNPFLAGRAYMLKAARETAATVPGKIALRQRDPTNVRPMMQGLWNKRR